ncbi:MAG: hypothetical protein ACYC0V_19970 [Armatimonadota bacterium]
MSTFPAGATKRILVECVTLAQQIGAANFGMLASGYLDLLQDQRPRLMVLSSSDDVSAAEIVTSLEERLPDWKLFQSLPNASESGNQIPFCDAGIVLTRATIPFREEEANLLRNNWRRAFHWSVLLSQASDADEEDLEEAQKFARRAFSLVSDLQQISNIWSDVDDCVGYFGKQSANSQERSELCLTEIRDASAALQERLEAQRAALAAETLRLSDGLSEKKQEYGSLFETLTDLQQKLQNDLSDAQKKAYQDVAKRMPEARMAIKSHIQSAPIGQLEQSLAEFLEVKSDKVFRTVSAQVENDFDAAVASACETLYAVRCKSGIGNRELAVVSESLIVNRPESAEMDTGQMIGKVASDDLLALQSSAGLGLLVARLDPTGGLVTGLATALGSYFTRDKDQKKRQDASVRDRLTSRALVYLQEFSTSFDNELRRIIPTTATEIARNVKHLCVETRDSIKDSHAGEFDLRRIADVQAKQAQTARQSESLSHLMQSIDREIDRQDMIRHLGGRS